MTLKLLLPEHRTSPAPVIYCINGGGWNSYGPNDEVGGLGKNIKSFLERGIAIAAVQYRLAPSAHFDEIMSDCFDGLRYLHKHAAGLGLDTRRIITRGGSAGAHLSMLCALCDPAEFPGAPNLAGHDGFKIIAEIDIFGPTVLYRIDGKQLLPVEASDMASMMMGFKCDDAHEAQYRRASPLCHIRADAPDFLIIHGREDYLVPVSNAFVFTDAARAAGMEVRTVIVENADHGFAQKDAAIKINPSLTEISDIDYNYCIEKIFAGEKND